MEKNPDIDILGGGPAGLAAGYFAHKRGSTFRIHEGNRETGGNCRTLRLGEFLFDTGAHRVHDKVAWVTQEIHSLLGEDLLRVSAPSSIVHEGKLLRFPLAPLDLLHRLDWRILARAGLEALKGTASMGSGIPHDFRDLAVSRYGKTLAELFLLNYSRKLWGREPSRLSVQVAGGRLAGLDLKTFFLDRLLRRARHLDGAFYYPKHGIGSLFHAMEHRMRGGHIACESRVTRIHHDGERIQGITINGREEYDTHAVISTLPLPLFLRILEPAPPKAILEIAGTISFRNVVLGVFCLDMERFTSNASLYFPDEEIPFTRIYEPKNRSRFMAPAGRTCIVVEIPCSSEDPFWKMDEGALKSILMPHLQRVRAFRGAQVLHCKAYRVPNAYPILEKGIEGKVAALLEYGSNLRNLKMAGRNALFQYAHIHDMFIAGREMWSSPAMTARAIEAPVPGAGPAGMLQTLLERLPGPVEPDHQVVVGDA